MDTRTGEIGYFTNKEILEMPDKKRKNMVALTQEQNDLLRGMNRKERREYYKSHKSDFNGLSWKEANGSPSQ